MSHLDYITQRVSILKKRETNRQNIKLSIEKFVFLKNNLQLIFLAQLFVCLLARVVALGPGVDENWVSAAAREEKGSNYKKPWSSFSM